MRRLSHLALALAALTALGCGTTYEFDSLSLGDDGASRAPVAISNNQFLRSVYADLVGRAPEAYDFTISDDKGQPITTFVIDEGAMLLSALDGFGDPDPLRAVITAGLVSSDDVTLPSKEEVSDPRAFITEQFHRFLGREPGSYELSAFVSEWATDDAVNPRTVVRALVGSREYQSR